MTCFESQESEYPAELLFVVFALKIVWNCRVQRKWMLIKFQIKLEKGGDQSKQKGQKQPPEMFYGNRC